MADVTGALLAGMEPADIGQARTLASPSDEPEAIGFELVAAANLLRTKRKEPVIPTERALVFSD